MAQKNKKKCNTAIQLSIGVLTGIIGSVYLIGKFETGELTPALILVYIVLIFIAVFININIHEFGHYIFGKALGYRLLFYRISIFAWNNENSKMKFSLIRNRGYSGLCGMLAPERRLASYKHALYIAGGLILNLLTGILFILVPSILSIHYMLANFFTITGVTALLLALLNFIPYISENMPTDGKLLWGLILKKPFAGKLMEFNELNTQLAVGVRPRDIKLSQPPSGDDLDYIDLMLVLYSYFKAIDTPAPEKVSNLAGIMERNLDILPAYILPGFYYELCYVSCIHDNPEKAGDYYLKSGKVLQRDKDINGMRVKAYYEYYINKNAGAALKLCEQGLSAAGEFPLKGQGEMEKDLLLMLLSHLRT